jgi:hypothetical protein
LAQFENPDGVLARIYVDDDTILDSQARLAKLPSLSPTQLDCLEQMVTPVWDGNLISKQTRNELCDMRLASRCQGLNFLTQDGYFVLYELGHLKDMDKFGGGKPWKVRRGRTRRCIPSPGR